MRYIEARHKLWEREEVCRIYITDSLRILTGATARYAEFFEPKETRTAQDIIEHIRGGLNGSF
jgi:hypothetical protein